MVHTDELIRRMIAEYADGADEDELLNRYEMRKDK